MTSTRIGRAAGLAFVGTLALGACGGQSSTDTTSTSTSGSGSGSGSSSAALTGSIITDGSSTVGPLASAAAELFMEENSGVNVTVGVSGTGGGFKKFCAGQTAISNASRPIKDEEIALCKTNGIEYQEIIVANDALTVVTNKDNAFLTCLTTGELKTLWEPAATDKVKTWNQVNASFPTEPIKLYGPGTDSGTFDYFTGAITGEEGASRSDYSSSEDDNVIVQGVSGEANALGYFGYTYFEENADKLKAVEIDNGSGCVAPSSDAARDGSYAPLSRPLYIYVDKKSWAKPEVKGFVTYFVTNDASIAEAAKFIALSEEQKAKATSEIAALG